MSTNRSGLAAHIAQSVPAGEWSTQDWVVDIVDKYVQAQATGAIFDRFLDPARH